MGWTEKDFLKKYYYLLNYGTRDEVFKFINSGYFQSQESDEDNVINDFKEYIQDQLDWELYIKTIQDGYN